MSDVYLRRHSTEHGDMIAMCDKSVLGRVYRDRKSGMVLDLKKYRQFYEGNLMTEEEALKEVSAADMYTGNMVGSVSVGIAIKAGIATGPEVRNIGGIPSLQVYRIV
ncbi:MAG: DUF424 family protein [Candidatus Marsarchaeota archaeon]|nr:DUF424 family protein [Candidatus Marsarchaeota archaeon]